MNALATADILDRCRGKLAELQSAGPEIAGLLRAMARELLESGRSPSVLGIERLAKYRSDFDELRSSIPSVDEAAFDEEISFAELRDEFDSQGAVQTTLARLDCIAMIQHIEQADFAPWQRCLADHTKLREELHSAPPAQARDSAKQFLSLPTPLIAIITLVAEGNNLSDERWSVLLDSVTAAYGRELSTAIARGKLILKTETRP